MGDIELTTAVLILSIVALLPVQLLLSIPTIIFTVMSVAITGWDGLGYIFLAIFTGFMLLMSGVGWGIWAISKLIKKKKANQANTYLLEHYDWDYINGGGDSFRKLYED